jgi:hypothetical protein
MALRSTQPLTEMSTRNHSGCKGRPACKVDKLTTICEPIVRKIWEPGRLTVLWASTTRYMDSFTCRRVKCKQNRWSVENADISYLDHNIAWCYLPEHTCTVSTIYRNLVKIVRNILHVNCGGVRLRSQPIVLMFFVVFFSVFRQITESYFDRVTSNSPIVLPSTLYSRVNDSVVK